MNKALPEIHERVEALKERLRQETRVRQKQRLQALYLLKSGQTRSRTQAGELLCISRRTVGEWLEWYEAEGLERLFRLDTHSNCRYSLTEEQDACLRQKLSEPEGFPSYTAAHAWVNETFGLDLDYEVVHQIVRYRHGAKLKGARKSPTRKQTSG
ncbi:MAG: helix-turn-helix domain-containing protein [Armatimonadetes bacterium]|nr:helix-turn-helix domain-containing protein [Armatimonadota bacterium]